MQNLLKYIVFGALLLLVGGYIGNCQSATKIERYNQQLATAQEYSRSVQRWSDSVYLESQARLQYAETKSNEIIDSLSKQIANRDVRIRTNAAQLATQRLKIDGLQDSIAKDTTCNGACQSALQLVDQAQEQTDSANARADLALEQFEDQKKITDQVEAKYVAMTSFAMLQVDRADSLDKEVKKWIKMPPAPDPDKLFGLIKLPSRTTSFFMGAGTILLAWGTTEAIN